MCLSSGIFGELFCKLSLRFNHADLLLEFFGNQHPNCLFQVLNAAWDVCIPVASENALPCLDRVGYNKILDYGKPTNDLDGRHFLSFTYLRLSPPLMEQQNFVEFEGFVKRMHGKST